MVLPCIGSHDHTTTRPARYTEQHSVVAGVESGRAQLRVALENERAGAHEIHSRGDAVGELAVAAGLRRVLDEAEHPLMHAAEIGEATGCERAQQVERRGGLA